MVMPEEGGNNAATQLAVSARQCELRAVSGGPEIYTVMVRLDRAISFGWSMA
jgi:hypothetical protein